MAKFYKRLPSELLDLDIDDFRLDYLMWYMHVMEENRQWEQHQVEMKAKYSNRGE